MRDLLFKYIYKRYCIINGEVCRLHDLTQYIHGYDLSNELEKIFGGQQVIIREVLTEWLSRCDVIISDSYFNYNLLPLTRRAVARTIANDLVSVQPMEHSDNDVLSVWSTLVRGIPNEEEEEEGNESICTIDLTHQPTVGVEYFTIDFIP